MSSQEQKGGIGSSNFQVGTITVGMTYKDVSDIARDVFDNNMSIYAQKAKAEADKRAQELREELSERLKHKTAEELSGFDQPDKQSALFEAQKAFALSGDNDLRSSLVNMVVQLSTAPQRGMKSIALQEAIKTAPVLTARQMKALSVVFVMRYVNLNPFSAAALESRIRQMLGGGYDSGQITQGDLRHIEYTRCGNIEIAGISFNEALRQSYPGIFSTGYTQEEVVSSFKNSGIPPFGFLKNTIDDTKFNLMFGNSTTLKINAPVFGWNPAQIIVADSLLSDKTRLYDDSTMNEKIVSQLGPTLLSIYRDWDSNSLQSLKLSSVRLTLAHACTIGATGNEADLDIWL